MTNASLLKKGPPSTTWRQVLPGLLSLHLPTSPRSNHTPGEHPNPSAKLRSLEPSQRRIQDIKMPVYSPFKPDVQLPSEPFGDLSGNQKAPGAHLTPSHAFPAVKDSSIVDPQHARASLSKTDSTDSKEHHHHADAEKGYESCASCRAKGKQPFQGHTDREEGCTCVIGEGPVPTVVDKGDAGKEESQHDI